MGLMILFLVWALALTAVRSNQKCHENLGACDKEFPCCATTGWCGKSFQHCSSLCFQPGNFPGVDCMADPQCESKDYLLSSENVLPESKYTGNYTSTDFTIIGDYEIKDDAVVLKMSKPNAGSTLHSTRYMQYGRVSAKIKTSRTGGVVSSFILVARDKDEIDFEWVGSNVKETQTNWFFKGKFPVWPKNNNQNFPTKDTHAGFSEYTINWTPTQIQWIIDGKVIRTLLKADPQYPTSPAQISFGIWDGGSNEEGTRNWAGGQIDWNSQDMKTQGYFDVHIKDIQVECYKTL
ncbi:putative glycosidase CRH2 [Entomophthora muscae]|uniref:Glycosidase CRH2 n=1 Tax=Entomophthora muscae TaxID=34485 RepID=A0ACC2T986_9FUNG|nr:putative glycosidase CRH2 [Entomophthora muscae]